MQVSGGNPRLNQLCARWQQVWLLALDRQRKLNDALDRLEELKEFANFDFDVWRKKYMRWMNHKKSRVMDFFRRIDKDQDGKITRQEFIDGILASKFPTSKLEMTAVADIFDRDGDGYIDYYEFVAALHPNKDAYRPTTDADKIEDEVTRQVAQCKCAKRFQVEQIGENKYRFGDSQQLRLVRILRSTVMVTLEPSHVSLQRFLPLTSSQLLRAAAVFLSIISHPPTSQISSHPSIHPSTPPRIKKKKKRERCVHAVSTLKELIIFICVHTGLVLFSSVFSLSVQHPGLKILRSDSSSSISSRIVNTDLGVASLGF
ncbi:hypothetical protein INR49_008108 [Caranx melampygus]|nr:hypothetical protein INR49_008108 [Caranx melampygus]